MKLSYVPDLYALIGEHDQLSRELCFSLKKKGVIIADNQTETNKKEESQEAYFGETKKAIR